MQGYPDNWTKYGADGTEIADTARYRAIGNSICVFCAERVYLGILDALTEVSESEREKLKPFLIKLLIVSLIVAVGFFAFVWLMAYLLACGEAAGLGQGLRV